MSDKVDELRRQSSVEHSLRVQFIPCDKSYIPLTIHVDMAHSSAVIASNNIIIAQNIGNSSSVTFGHRTVSGLAIFLPVTHVQALYHVKSI